MKDKSNNAQDTNGTSSDFQVDFGPGDLADSIKIKEFDDQQIQLLKNQLDDFYFNIGAVPMPRGPIIMPPQELYPHPGAQRGGQEGGQAPQKGRVIPCDNVIIDESDGAGGGVVGGGPGPGQENGPKVIEIPPNLKNCIFTQHHKADNGDNWVVLIRIQKGRIKQVVVTDENGNGTAVHRNVGRISKVHKDNNKITVVGARRVCTYFIQSNRLVCVRNRS